MYKWGRQNKLNIPKMSEDAIGGVFACGAYIFLVVDEKPKKTYWNVIDTIIHESVHVFQKAMAFCQEDEAGGEVTAYHIGSIATNMMQEYVKREKL